MRALKGRGVEFCAETKVAGIDDGGGGIRDDIRRIVCASVGEMFVLEADFVVY